MAAATVISPQALMTRDECWWHTCRLPGAPVEAGMGEDDQSVLVRLCAFCAVKVARLLEVGLEVQVLESPQGVPVMACIDERQALP